MKTLNKWGMIFPLFFIVIVFTQCEETGFSNPEDNTAILEERGGGSMTLCTCLSTTFPEEDLSDTETNALIYMREEEKLARDVYLRMATTWNAQVFQNIAKAEQRHMDAVLCLLNKYALPDPVGVHGSGVFANDTLQQLYNTLITEGSVSLVEAFRVGATIEDLDISDLLRLRANAEVDNVDVREVFSNLVRGSRNHLRAFAGNLDQQGVIYTPQYITPEQYTAIVNGDWESGDGTCGICTGPNNGGPIFSPHGNKPGWGNGQFGPHGTGNGTGICPWNNTPGNGTPPGNGTSQGNGKRKRG